MGLKLKEINEYPLDFKTVYRFDADGRTAELCIEFSPTSEGFRYYINYINFTEDEEAKVKLIADYHLKNAERIIDDMLKRIENSLKQWNALWCTETSEFQELSETGYKLLVNQKSRKITPFLCVRRAIFGLFFSFFAISNRKPDFYPK